METHARISLYPEDPSYQSDVLFYIGVSRAMNVCVCARARVSVCQCVGAIDSVSDWAKLL